jgi:arylsulfatase A-like enzyme
MEEPRTIRRRTFLKGLAAALPAAKATERRPNFVFILGDDVGWADLGCYGNRYHETPNLDRLSREGMRFTDAYASASQCAPTRACLLTGREVGRHRVWAVDRLRGLEKFRKVTPPPNNTELPLGETTMAQVLRSSGYATGMFGKWHLGTNGNYHPSRRGFDEAIVTSTDPGRHFDFITIPRIDVSPEEYLADFLTDRAVSFIDAHRKEPFFLYLPHFVVHGPLQAKKALLDKYNRKPRVGRFATPVYAAMMESLDESVGRIMKRLTDLDLADDTVLLFYSDNGAVGGYVREGLDMGRSPTDNYPLRGGKGMLYEGGIRVPLIVRWPKAIAPGSVCNVPVTSTDFFPTFVELAAARQPRNALDGVSLAPLLRSSGNAIPTREAICWHYPGYLQAEVEKGTWRIEPSGAIRSGRYKLIERFADGRLELFDLEADPGETRDLAPQNPEQARRLRAVLARWRQSTNAPMPVPKR